MLRALNSFTKALIFIIAIFPVFLQAEILFSEQVQLNNAPLNSPGFLVDDGSTTALNMPSIISPDGQRVVYLANQVGGTGMTRLFSVLTGGGGLILLDTFRSLNSTFRLNNIKISPNSKYVVYQTGFSSVGESPELLSVSIEGGEPIRLSNTPLPNRNTPFANGATINFEVSADSQKVVFSEVLGIDSANLFSVSIEGGALTKLSAQDIQLSETRPIFKISPDGNRVVYVVHSSLTEELQLFSVATSGGLPEVLDSFSSLDSSIFDFEITPNSQQVLYTAGITEVGLYRVSLMGEGAVKVIDSFDQTNAFTGTDANTKISPDSKYAVFLNNLNNIESVSITDDSLPVLIGSVAEIGVEVSLLSTSFQISPDSQKIVYLSRVNGNLSLELLSSSISSAKIEAVRLSPISLISGGEIGGVASFVISQDSKYVVFIADVESPGTNRVFSTLLNGGKINKLSGSLETFSFPFSGNAVSDRVFFVAHDANFISGLYSATIDGRELKKINGELPQGEFVDFFQVSSDEGQVVYLTGSDFKFQENLFSVSQAPADELCFPIISANKNFALICL